MVSKRKRVYQGTMLQQENRIHLDTSVAGLQTCRCSVPYNVLTTMSAVWFKIWGHRFITMVTCYDCYVQYLARFCVINMVFARTACFEFLCPQCFFANILAGTVAIGRSHSNRSSPMLSQSRRHNHGMNHDRFKNPWMHQAIVFIDTSFVYIHKGNCKTMTLLSNKISTLHKTTITNGLFAHPISMH